MSAQDFFRQQQQAFAATLDARRGAASLATQLLAQAADSFGANAAQQCADEPPLACGRGCATCCTLRVSATAPEVLAVAAFLRAVQPRLLPLGIDLVGQLRAADAATHGLGEAQRVAQRQRCPFIAQGACVIYAVRPLACRGHASHDLRACAEAAAGRRDEVPYSAGHRLVRALVQGALQSALRDAGLAWRAYELNAALRLAMDDEQADAAWRAGADPLAAAVLDEAEADEMARAFDALR